MFLHGEVAVFQLRPANMGAHSPPDITPALATVPAGDSPVEVLLVLAEEVPEVAELMVIQIQQACMHAANILGVTTVTMLDVLVYFGLSPHIDNSATPGGAALIDAVNAAVGGVFTTNDSDSVFAVAMALAGAAGPWSLPAVFQMLPARSALARPDERAADTPGRARNGHSDSKSKFGSQEVAGRRGPSQPHQPRGGAPRAEQRGDGYLTLDGVAQILDVSLPTVRRLIRSAKLAALRIGRQLRVAREDLERYLAQSRQPTVDDLALERRASLHALGVRLPRRRAMLVPKE